MVLACLTRSTERLWAALLSRLPTAAQEHAGHASEPAPLLHRSLWHRQPWPTGSQRLAGTGFRTNRTSLVGILDHTCVKAWAEVSCLATSGSKLKAVIAMPTDAAVSSGLL